MSDSGSLINIGELAKPATVLIEKISNAIGVVFESHQIRRIARAQADAAVIEAESQIQVSAIHRRAMLRFIEEEGKRQENIESITAKAIPYLDDNSKPEGIEDDWITNFFDKCRIISDDEMQLLWARVLAGEANRSGSFARRTVNLLSDLDKSDALSFVNLNRFSWSIGGSTPLIYDESNEVYEKAGINFGVLTHLDVIGLIRFQPLSGFRWIGFQKRALAEYFGTPILLEFPNEKESENSLAIGRVVLTRAGEELVPVAVRSPVDDFIDYVVKIWGKEGLCPASPLPRKP